MVTSLGPAFLSSLRIALAVRTSSARRGMRWKTGGPICAALMPVTSAAAVWPRAISSS